MALNIKKPSGAAPQSKPAAPSKPSAGGGLSFLKKGKAAQETFAKEEHKAEMKAKNSNVFRFYVPVGNDSAITFLDGNLVDGVLDIPFYYEHQVNLNGSWMNWFICTQDEEPCPICEGGQNAGYVGVMTVIDHSSYTSKKDGKTYKDQVRLFVAKRDTIKLLQKLAAKRGGSLAGCRFDVTRTGDKSPPVGTNFDFVDKSTPEQIAKLYGADKKAINYEEYLGSLYLPAKELRKMGFGSMTPPVGSESSSEADYDESL